MSLLDTASLIVTPNGYKEGKLYSVIPSDGSGDLSVTRATTATRVNSQGLVELVPYNLLTYSKDLSSGYTFNQCSATSSVTAPDGTNNAKRITNGSTTTDVYFEQSVTFSPSVYTWSVYVKQGTAATATIKPVHVGLGADVSLMTFTFATQTITSSGSITSTGFTNEGNGWFRIYCSVTIPSSVVSLRGRFGNPNTPNVYNDWAYPQLVEGSVAKDYQKTETRLNIPRLDYSNGTCPSILVEPQRTNLVTWSSSFDNSSWGKTNMVIVANATTAPDGTNTAEKATSSLYPSTSIFKSQILTATNHTFSCYVKADTLSSFRLDLVTAGFALGSNCIYNLTTQSTTITNYGATTGSTATITSVGNGWYRCSLTVLTTAVTYFAQLYPAGNGSIYVWGAQLEVGSYATSYIPTTSASVTRNADRISKTGISSLFGTNQGTFFCDFVVPNTDSLSNQYIFDLSDGVNSTINRLAFYKTTSNSYQLFTNTGTNFSINVNTRNKVAIVWNGSNVKIFANGSQLSSITYANTNPTQINLGTRFTGGEVGDVYYNSTSLWKTALTDTQLAQLTTI